MLLKKICAISFSLFITSFLFSQSLTTSKVDKWLKSSYTGEIHEEIPVDIDVQTLVFLEYEEIEITESMSKQERKMMDRRNKKYFPDGNSALKSAVKGYPYPYAISKRSEKETWKDQGYKYFLDAEVMKQYNEGVNLYAGKDYTGPKVRNPHTGRYESQDAEFVSTMYIIDIETGERYSVFKISQQYAFAWKPIIKKLTKKIEKQILD